MERLKIVEGGPKVKSVSGDPAKAEIEDLGSGYVSISSNKIRNGIFLLLLEFLKRNFWEF